VDRTEAGCDHDPSSVRWPQAQTHLIIGFNYADVFRSERGCRQAVPGIEHLRGVTIIAQEKGCHGMSLAIFIPIAMNCVNDEF
jgi:hypothetical protein